LVVPEDDIHLPQGWNTLRFLIGLLLVFRLEATALHTGSKV
jgi:hypothetical protein